MMCKSRENLLILKLNHPISEDSVLKYIDSPSDYILRKRLGLDEEEVSAIRVLSRDCEAGFGKPS